MKKRIQTLVVALSLITAQNLFAANPLATVLTPPFGTPFDQNGILIEDDGSVYSVPVKDPTKKTLALTLSSEETQKLIKDISDLVIEEVEQPKLVPGVPPTTFSVYKSGKPTKIAIQVVKFYYMENGEGKDLVEFLSDLKNTVNRGPNI